MAGIAATYLNANQFAVSGDYTAHFIADRATLCDCGVDGEVKRLVESSAFGAGATTVTLKTDGTRPLTSNLTDVEWAVVKPGSLGNIPLHGHEDDDDGGLASGAPAAHKNSHDPEDGADPLDCAAAGEIVGVAAAAEGSAHSFARSDHTHQVQHGIADNHVVTVDGSPGDDEYARWTANGLEGRTTAEVVADLGVGETGFSPDSVETKTADYSITTSDFNKCLRMDAAIDKTFTLPSVGSGEDGKRITLISLGGGITTITGSDSDTVANAPGLTISTRSGVTLEYIHSETDWQIVALWPESGGAILATKGYFAGGYTGSYVDTADKIVFSTDTTAAQASADLSQARHYLAGLSEGSTKGYFAGGLTGSYVNTADKIVFSTDTTAAQASADLSQARYSLAGLSEGSTKGYFAGGYTDSYVDTADRIVFSTDTTAAQASADLSQARNLLAGLSEGSTKGYFAGGHTGSYVDTADKIVYSTDTTAAQASADLSQARRALAGLSDIAL